MKKFVNCAAVSFAIAILLSTPRVAWAGNEGGAGGNGVLINGVPYLFDFVEHGIEETPYFDQALRSHRNFPDAVTELSGSRIAHLLSSGETELMALKLLEIGAVDSSLARIFFSQFMHRLRFFLVNKELVDAWASSSVIDARDRVQLAVRRNQEVRINKQLFEQLTPSNKTGLLIHEAVTHFSYPSEANYEDQRRAVARLFMSELRNNGGELLTEVTGSLDNASRKLPTFGITIFNGEEAAALIKMTLNGRQVILSYTEDAQVSAKRLCGNWTSGTSVVIIGGKNLTIRVWHDFDLENSFLIYQTSTWMPPLYQYTINGNQCQTEIVNTILHVREELRAQDFWAPNK